MDNVPSVSVTIPLYNEEGLICSEVTRIIEDLEHFGLTNFEVVLVENGSTDSTLTLARELSKRDGRLRVIHLPQADYGGALKAGFMSSKSQVIANFSIDFADVRFLVEALSKTRDFDVVLGSKYAARKLDRRPLPRRLGGVVLGGFFRVLFGLPVADTHGLMVLRREKVAPLVSRCCSRNEIFDTELIVRAHRSGLKILELPVSVEEKRSSRVGYIRRGARLLRHAAGLWMALSREGIL